MANNAGKPQDVTLPGWPPVEGVADGPVLDPQQCEAACNAHKLFVAMANRPDAEDAKESEFDSFLPRVDEHRRNHTILIDGSRGSGKTAVMLRLLKDWGHHLKGNKLPPKLAEVATMDEDVVIVPVGLLDLEAVPQSANLATRMAGMFVRVVAAMERRGTTAQGRSAPSWAALETDTLGSREKWRTFVNAAALEWDRSLERRRSGIDPEAYAVEVEQAESKGLRARRGRAGAGPCRQHDQGVGCDCGC